MNEAEVGNPAFSSARWFISTTPGVDLSALIVRLRQHGVDPFVLSDVAQLGFNALDSILQAIRRADLMLLVLGPGAASSNAMFEAGIATGLGKPVLVVADPSVKIPGDVAGLPTIRARPEDVRAIDFFLDQARGRIAHSPSVPSATGRSLGSRVDELLARLESPGMWTERSAVAVLEDALEHSGVIAAEGREGDARHDLGVWSDDLDAIGGNPLLIEVKKTLDRGALDQASRWLATSPTARLALLVSLEPIGKTIIGDRGTSQFPVLMITLGDLLEQMRSVSFAEVVRNLRNRSVHGLPL